MRFWVEKPKPAYVGIEFIGPPLNGVQSLAALQNRLDISCHHLEIRLFTSYAFYKIF